VNVPLLALREATVVLSQERTVLDRVSVALAPGERVGLRGPNGSCKSTLLLALMGLLPLTAGAVVHRGRVCGNAAAFRDMRRETGLLFQDPDDQLFCPTVEEDVAFGPLNLRRSLDEARADALEALASLNAAELASRHTHALSQGEKRVVALAGVLAMAPNALLLDEPEAGLDAETQQRLLARLEEADMAMLIVSHDRDVLERLTTRTVTLREGRTEGAAGA
jgi:cobalt/nickel transport system ATP-binding protein